jgi:hypothetical protein
MNYELESDREQVRVISKGWILTVYKYLSIKETGVTTVKGALAA